MKTPFAKVDFTWLMLLMPLAALAIIPPALAAAYRKRLEDEDKEKGRWV